MPDSNQPTRKPTPRLALVITELGVGGAEKCVSLLAAGIRDHGLEPEVISLAPPPPPDYSQLVKQLEAANVPLHFLCVRHATQIFQAVKTLTRILKRIQPSILQSFLFHANIVSALAARRAHVPRVFAGLRVAEPATCRWGMLRLASSRFEKFVCVSESVAKFAAVQGLSASQLTVIPNGIDLEQTLQRPGVDLQTLGISANRRTLLCVARFEPQKGIDWLLQQIPTIFQRLPEFDLILVGTGSQWESVRQQMVNHPWANRVHLLGQRDDVLELMKASDLVVIPSRWEGMPNVLLEAMACERPVVAHRVHGISEVLGQLADQQTVALDQPNAFVQQIVTLCSNRDQSQLLGRMNYQRIQEKFTADRIFAAYAALYQSAEHSAP